MRIAEPEIVRLLSKHGADPRFVHHANYLRDYGQPRKESISLIEVAKANGPIVEWHGLDRDARKERVPELLAALPSHPSK